MRYGPLIVLVLAAVIRFHGCMNLGCISRDGVQFVSYAKRLAIEPIAALRDTTKQPGMPALMLAVNRIAINEPFQEHPLIWQATGQLLAFFGGVSVCLLILVLARRLFRNEWLALLAGLLACVWPQGVQLSGDVLSDMPHLALYLAALLLGHAAIDRACLRRLALCGFLAGLAYLIRQEAMGILAAVMICWLFGAVLSLKRRVIGAGVLFLMFAVVVSPYSVAAGRIMPNKTIGELLWGSDAVSVDWSPVLEGGIATGERWRQVLDASASLDVDRSAPVARAEPMMSHLVPWYQAPARMVEEWCKSGRYVISTLVLLALFLRSSPKADRSCARLVVAAVVLQVIAVQLRVKSYGEISSRYLLIPAALCIPWASAGMMTIVQVIARRLSELSLADDARSRESGMVIAAVESFEDRSARRLRSLWLSASILVFVPMAYYATQQIGADKVPYKLAGTWLRHQTDPADRVLAHDRLEQVMFYAKRAWPMETWLRYESEQEDLERVVELLAVHRPDYFLDARSSRRGVVGKENSYWDALELLDGYEPAWTSGDAPHEVRIYRRAPRD